MKKPLCLCLWLIVLIGFSGPACAWLQSGEPAPDFELSDLEGNKVRLSDFQGRIILLQLGTTWCPDCLRQSRDLLEMDDFLFRHEAVVVKVFFQENRGRVIRFMQDKNFTVSQAVLLDDGRVHRAYRVFPIPRLLIIDRRFRIVRDGLRPATGEIQTLIAGLDQTVTADSNAEEVEH